MKKWIHIFFSCLSWIKQRNASHRINKIPFFCGGGGGAPGDTVDNPFGCGGEGGGGHRLHLWHMEVPGPGIEPAPQQQPKPLQSQCQIFNPLRHRRTPRSCYTLNRIFGSLNSDFPFKIISTYFIFNILFRSLKLEAVERMKITWHIKVLLTCTRKESKCKNVSI